MRDEIIKRNVLIITIALIVFTITSSLVWNHFSRGTLENQLINISKIVNNQIYDTTNEEELHEVVNSFTKDSEWLNIVVANSNGNIIIDSTNDVVGDAISANLSKEELVKANSNNVDKDNLYTIDNTLYYISKLNDDIIVRTSMELENTSLAILESFFFIIIIGIVTIILSIMFTRRTTDRITSALEGISNNLRLINQGTYQEIDTNHRYQEVALSLKEINEISNNIFNSIQMIQNDREKLQMVIDNIDQGLLIIGDNEEILLINSYARAINNMDVDVTGMNFHSLPYIPSAIHMIEETIHDFKTRGLDVFDEKLNKIFFVTINCFDNTWQDIVGVNKLLLIKFSDVTIERLEDKSRSEFISNASHELKTPITSISGFSELLLSMDIFTPDIMSYLNIIHTESLKMKKTIEQLLLLSNLENRLDRFDLNEDVNVIHVVDDIIDTFRPMIEKMNLEIIKDLEVKEIKCNEVLIQQIIQNLIENAIKYNKDNGSITIRTKINNNNYQLIVEDTGIGMEKKYLDQIFERFYRIDESHNSKIPGTGIGLNLVKQICKIIGANINIESTIDVGSTFIVEIPIKE